MERTKISKIIVLITVLAITFSSFCGISSMLSVSADGETPAYNSEIHADISALESLNASKQADGTWSYNITDINFINYVSIVNTGLAEDAVLYCSAVLPAGVYATDGLWDGQYLPIATATDGSGSYGNLVVKFTQGDNIDIQLVNNGNVTLSYVGATVQGLKPAYPETGASFGSTNRKITYSLSKTHFTLWVDGVKVIDNFEWASGVSGSGAPLPITIDSFLIGAAGVNSKTQISEYRVWAEKEYTREPQPIYVSGKNIDITSSEEIDIPKAADGTYSFVSNESNYSFVKTPEKVIVSDEAVFYGAAKIASDTFKENNNAVLIPIAKNESGNITIGFTAANGVELCISDDTGNIIQSIHKVSYPDGDAFGADTRKIAYRISKTELSVWVGSEKVIDGLRFNENNPAVAVNELIIGMIANGDSINVTGYRVWADSDKVKVIVPTYDSELHIDVSAQTGLEGAASGDGSYSFTTTSTSYSQLKAVSGVIIEKDATIYGSVTIGPSALQMNQWGGVILPVAYAEYQGESGYLFVKFTQGDRIDVQFDSDGRTEPSYIGASISALKPAYPDGTPYFGGNPHDVVYMVNNKSFTLWVDGVKVIDNYIWDSTAGREIVITDFILGIEAVNSYINATGYRVWVDKSEGTVMAPVFEKGKNLDISANVSLKGEYADDGSYTVVSDSESFETVVKLTSEDISDVATVYGTAAFNTADFANDSELYMTIGKAAHLDMSGDLQIVLTSSNGVALRLTNGKSIRVLGDTISRLAMTYPEDSINIQKGEIKLSYQLSKEKLSIWIGEIQILSEFKLKEAADAEGNPCGIYVSAFSIGVGAENIKLQAQKIRLWTDMEYTPTPAYNSKADVNLLDSMQAVTIGDGPILKKESGNVIVGSSDVGDGDGTNSGVMFAAPVIKNGGTMYLHTVITTDTVLDNSILNSETYGAPVIRLANVKFHMQEHDGGHSDVTGYLDILFTEGDKIDFRVRDITGFDEFYLGSTIPDFKLIYPDTYTGTRGEVDYEVTIAINNRCISMWINGKAVLLNHSLFELKSSNAHTISVIDVLDFAPGVLYNLSKGTCSEFEVWCSKEDYEPFELGEVAYPDAEPVDAFIEVSDEWDNQAAALSSDVKAETTGNTEGTKKSLENGKASEDSKSPDTSFKDKLPIAIIGAIAVISYVLMFGVSGKSFMRMIAVRNKGGDKE